MLVNNWTYLTKDAINKIEKNFGNIKGIATTLHTNVDAIHALTNNSVKIFNSKKFSLPQLEKLSIIKSKKSLSQILNYCLLTGSGKEYEITDNLINWLSQNLSPIEYEVGGHGGRISNILSSLGVNVYVHISRLGKKQYSLFSHPSNMFIPIIKHGQIKFENPVAQNRKKTDIHFVIEFDKSTCFRLGEKTLQPPYSNKLIFSNDHSKFPMLNPHFEAAASQISKKVSSLLISGLQFRQVTRKIEKGSSNLLGRISNILKDMRSSNPHLKIHFEMSDYKDKQLLAKILRLLGSDFHSIGMNKEELCIITEALFGNSIVNDSSNMLELINTCKHIIEEIETPSIILHGRDTTMCIVSPNFQFDEKKLHKALLFGQALASVYGEEKSIMTLLDMKSKFSTLPLLPSKIGILQHKELSSSIANPSFSEKGYGYDKTLDLNLLLVVNHVSKNHKPTTGMGDAFCAGFLSGEAAIR